MLADLAVVLGGGGARAAYEAGVLRRIGRSLPRFRPGTLVGESAGAINAAYLAAHAEIARQEFNGDRVRIRCAIPRYLLRHIEGPGVNVRMIANGEAGGDEPRRS